MTDEIPAEMFPPDGWKIDFYEEQRVSENSKESNFICSAFNGVTAQQIVAEHNACCWLRIAKEKFMTNVYEHDCAARKANFWLERCK